MSFSQLAHDLLNGCGNPPRNGRANIISHEMLHQIGAVVDKNAWDVASLAERYGSATLVVTPSPPFFLCQFASFEIHLFVL
jgi:hypothetical protein